MENENTIAELDCVDCARFATDSGIRALLQCKEVRERDDLAHATSQKCWLKRCHGHESRQQRLSELENFRTVSEYCSARVSRVGLSTK